MANERWSRRQFLRRSAAVLGLTGAALGGLVWAQPGRAGLPMGGLAVPRPTRRRMAIPGWAGAWAEVRKFPFPYKAMVAITSDIDGTSLEEFERIHRFLNTREMTEKGPGLGLDIGDSFWMFVDTDWDGAIDVEGHPLREQMAYWRSPTDRRPFQAAAIAKYIRCGWIDSIHSWGDFNKQQPDAPGAATFRREMAEAAVAELTREKLHVQVWIDHGNKANVQSFAGSSSWLQAYQAGDRPGLPYYHTDLTIPYGIRFGWGATASAWEYEPGGESLLRPLTLRDGRRIWNFTRYSCNGPRWQQDFRFIWNPYFLHEQLRAENRRRWKAEGWYCAVAQHLGGPNELYFPFLDEAVAALRELAEEQAAGEILVARTSRLLNYNLAEQFVVFEVRERGPGQLWAQDQAQTQAQRRDQAVTTPGRYVLNILRIDDPHLGTFVPAIDAVRGMTFYVPDPAHFDLAIGGQLVPAEEIMRNQADHTGRPSIGVRWFEPDLYDYTRR
ncbi:hypothetical protein [Heliophilum fasciatum]|uniref:Uncharacterized protein n=1 Tax=Heliophilum fasciatum TaxID=35700 RepID=A0A4R2RMB1_9FIRM|nr:hypothetical protein [Heliophilum fasciatum]MCW2278848.1 hypothetical protein [Heliophilum fasciatum]TCP64068.1 hypothetical protein EDD73_11229 [Heliophilum fasciatum]